MSLLNSIKKRSKKAETATNESQSPASSWRNTFKTLHWPRMNQDLCKPHDFELLNANTADGDLSESSLELLQTKTTAPQAFDDPGKSDIPSSSDRQSMNNRRLNDPDLLPTAYPLTRTDPRPHLQPKWGSLNLAASAAQVAGSLKRYDCMRNGRPLFRLGPRVPPCDDDDEGHSVDSSATGQSRPALLEDLPPKYTYISQDGKLVKREIYRWPRHSLPMLGLRYKLCEPYASNYGKMSAKRAGLAGQKLALPQARWIYERPIFMLPRSIVNGNKHRLMSRHMLQDRPEPAPCYRVPCKVFLNEREMGMRYREFQTLKYVRETKARIAYEEWTKSRVAP